MPSWTLESATGSPAEKLSQHRDMTLLEAGTKRHHALADFVVRLGRDKPLGAIGGTIVLVLLFCGIFADVVAPYEMDEMEILDRFAGASSKHLLGADQAGRDILSRLIYGARVSLIVGLGATTVTVAIATTIGVPSGYFGGKFDIILQRFVDAWISLPFLLILLTIMSIMGRGMLQIILVIGVLSGIGWSRVVRSAVIGIKENDYFLAAKAIGSTDATTMRRHIIPNIMAPIIVIYSITVGSSILAEAGLSFLGFGLPFEVPSWGGMLSGEGRRYIDMKPTLALWPGVCLTVVVYSVNMFGDAIRDLLDPRLRGG